MIKLYQYDVCPYCCKVKAVLDYKHIPYEKIEVNPMTHEELQGVAGAMEYNKVPVLVDAENNGRVVFESNDIIRYLDETYPQRPVFAPSDTGQKAQKEWMDFVDEELVQVLPGNIYRSILEAIDSFKYITKVGNFPLWKRYYLMLGGAIAMNIVAKKGLKKRGIKDPREALKKSLAKWSNGLGTKKFMGGDTPDVTDLVCFGVLSAVHEMKVWPFIESLESIPAWYDRVQKTFKTKS